MVLERSSLLNLWTAGPDLTAPRRHILLICLTSSNSYLWLMCLTGSHCVFLYYFTFMLAQSACVQPKFIFEYPQHVWVEKKINIFNLFILDTSKKVLWQTVKTRMKCCIMQHLIKGLHCLLKTIFRDRNMLKVKM